MTKKKIKISSSFFIVVFLLGSIVNVLYFFHKEPTECSSCIHAAESITETPPVLYNKILFWKNFISVNQTYTPGLIRLSQLYIKNEDFIHAQDTLNKSLFISPNNQEAKSLLNAISER